MIFENKFKQGSESWLAARMQSIGGTGISKLITTKGARSKSREDYIYTKAGQRLTGKSKSVFQTYEMTWGHTYEPEAREIFEITKDVEVETCAMIFSDENRNWHISPDGYMDNAGLEIKCPQLKAYDKYVSGGVLPTEHILQVQTSLALTDFEHWFYMVYFPGLKPMILKIERDETLIKIIKAEVKIFNRDLENLINRLKGE